MDRIEEIKRTLDDPKAGAIVPRSIYEEDCKHLLAALEGKDKEIHALKQGVLEGDAWAKAMLEQAEALNTAYLSELKDYAATVTRLNAKVAELQELVITRGHILDAKDEKLIHTIDQLDKYREALEEIEMQSLGMNVSYNIAMRTLKKIRGKDMAELENGGINKQELYTSTLLQRIESYKGEVTILTGKLATARAGLEGIRRVLAMGHTIREREANKRAEQALKEVGE